MRIEKINDNQIKCVLSQKDLNDRELRITELAYGTEKAKTLFHDMIQQASYEFGFETDDIPIMIEAIPTFPDSLVVLISKVTDPDEVDTRFSTFTDSDDMFDSEDIEDINDDLSLMYPSDEDDSKINNYDYDEDDDDEDEIIPHDHEDDDFTDYSTDTMLEDSPKDFVSLSEALGMAHRPADLGTPSSRDVIKIYSFDSLETVSLLAEHLLYNYSGDNQLYKDKDKFYLVIHKSDHSTQEFSKICNTISEYGTLENGTYASSTYYEEHYEPFIKKDALQLLGNL